MKFQRKYQTSIIMTFPRININGHIKKMYFNRVGEYFKDNILHKLKPNLSKTLRQNAGTNAP